MVLGSALTLGLDVGTTGVRAVELSWENDLPVVERWSAIDFEAEITDWGSANAAQIAGCIRHLVQEHSFKAKLVAHSVCGKGVIPQYFNFPQLMPEDVPEAVRIEVESGLPFRIENTLVTYILFPSQRATVGRKRTHGMAIAADGAFVQRRLEVIRKAGLEPFCVETDATACANAFIATHNQSSQNGTTAILNVGHHYSNLALLGYEGTLLMRDMPWGGYHLTRRIAERLPVPENEARRLKELHWSQGPATAESLQEGLPEILRMSAQDLVTRLRDTVHYWVGEKLVPKVERLFLTGGGSQVRGLSELLAETLSVPVEHWSLAKGITAAGGGERAEWDYRLTVAFGLALRRFSRS